MCLNVFRASLKMWVMSRMSLVGNHENFRKSSSQSIFASLLQLMSIMYCISLFKTILIDWFLNENFKPLEPIVELIQNSYYYY
jgi:hypothetical protein